MILKEIQQISRDLTQITQDQRQIHISRNLTPLIRIMILKRVQTILKVLIERFMRASLKKSMTRKTLFKNKSSINHQFNPFKM